MKTYVVYDHISPSGKHYVGQTCQKPETRWGKDGAGYLKKKNNGEYFQPAFAKAIIKYGWDNFKHEILFSGLSKQDANLIEIDLVYYYQKEGLSYNTTKGGEGHLKYDDGSTWYSRNREKKLRARKEYYEKHKEYYCQKAIEWMEANKEKVKARQAAYREAHKEEYKARKKACYEANKEKRKAYQKAYYASHKEEINAKRREQCKLKKQSNENSNE